MSHQLAAIRKEIDNTNLKVLELLNHRLTLVEQISRYKDEKDIVYFDPMREQEMLELLFKNNTGPLPDALIKEIFAAVFSASLKYMGLTKEQKLLISSGANTGFLQIHEIFNIPSNEPMVIAGPCAVENMGYVEEVAVLLKKNGVKFLRGGAFKPRTSPYDFQGLKEDGLKILHEVGKSYGLITVSEIVDTRDLDIVSKYIDVLQIGARNMYNYELLKEVGQSKLPVLLKRGLSSTIQELMFAAEYIGLQGNRRIILCERGIRTFETKTRNTMDISSVAIIKKETCLPVIVDLSHSLGRKDIINPIAKAALAVGADGIMVEVHPYPELALSDSKQQLNSEEFTSLMNVVLSSKTGE